MLDSEIGNAITIQDLDWKRAPSGTSTATFNNFKIYMGYSTLDVLGNTFLNNYISGSRTLVFSRSSYTVNADANQWFTTTLDTPFFYNGSNNLIIEFEWSSGTESVYIWHWPTGSIRGISGPYGSPDADESEPNIPHLRLSGTLDMGSATFAEIKAGRL